MDVITDLIVERVPIDSVTEHPLNARRGDVEVIRESLRTHGQYAPIVVQRSTSYVLKGNHTHRAAKEEGWTDIAVAFVDVDDDQAKRILLVDNRASDLGSYAEETLTELLASLNGDLAGTGYEPGDLDARLAELQVNDSQGLAAGEMLEGWQNKDARTILLTYTVAEQTRLCDRLDELARRFAVDTYSQVVARLVDDAFA